MNSSLQHAGHRLTRLRDAAVARAPWLRHIGWAEVILLACALAALLLANQFLELTDDVREGETRAFERAGLLERRG
jgi:hypothetical protein